jgi:hypothetical protein
MSRDELDRHTPVKPPIVNRKMKPNTQIIGTLKWTLDP